MRKLVLPGLTLCGFAMLVACSGSSNNATTSDEKKDAGSTPAAANAPAEPVLGKTAYWEMYTRARKEFATDLMPVSLEAKEIPGIKNGDGKAAMWTVNFVSDSKKEMSTYTYAIATHPPDIYKGVIPGGSKPWAGAGGGVMPFSMNSVSIDSDAALKSASMDAAAWLKQNPNVDPPEISLKEPTRLQIPTWIVKWGNEKKGFVSLVSAVDGKPVTGKGK